MRQKKLIISMSQTEENSRTGNSRRSPDRESLPVTSRQKLLKR